MKAEDELEAACEKLRGILDETDESLSLDTLIDHLHEDMLVEYERAGPVSQEDAANQSLSKVDWERVPSDVAEALFSTLALICRTHPGRCFCTCHITDI